MTSAAIAQPSPETMFSFSRVGSAAVVTLACPAVREWQASVLSTYLSDVVEQHRGRAVIVDVGGITQFSCAWLNALIELSRRCERMGGQLVVVGMSRQSRNMLRSTGLLKHLRLAGNSQEACASAGSRGWWRRGGWRWRSCWRSRWRRGRRRSRGRRRDGPIKTPPAAGNARLGRPPRSGGRESRAGCGAYGNLEIVRSGWCSDTEVGSGGLRWFFSFLLPFGE